VNASNPPADAPIPTIVKGLEFPRFDNSGRSVSAGPTEGSMRLIAEPFPGFKIRFILPIRDHPWLGNLRDNNIYPDTLGNP
jgi:hypothetical protein